MRILYRLAELVIGQVSWTPPFWLATLGRWMNAHRRITAFSIVLLAALSAGSWWGYRYYTHLPKPQTVTVSARPLMVTGLQEELRPPALVLTFDASVAPLDQIHKSVMDGIRIEPALRGFWRWESDRQLTFHTRDDWPADTTCHISIDKNAVSPHILLDRYTLDVTTPKFASFFKKLEF